jgi:hypothetical protein
MKMLKWFRARAGTWALVALCSFTAVGTLSTAHELRCGDELAEGFVAGHRPGSHSVAATRVGQELAHCVLCHWLQSVRSGGAGTSSLVIVHESGPARTVSSVQRVRLVVPLDVLSRAPPA